MRPYIHLTPLPEVSFFSEGGAQVEDTLEALNLLIAARNAEGAVVTELNVYQWMFKHSSDFRQIEVVRVKDIDLKLGKLFPCYDTKTNAENAVILLGEKNILKALNTLSGV